MTAYNILYDHSTNTFEHMLKASCVCFVLNEQLSNDCDILNCKITLYTTEPEKIQCKVCKVTANSYQHANKIARPMAMGIEQDVTNDHSLTAACNNVLTIFDEIGRPM